MFQRFLMLCFVMSSCGIANHCQAGEPVRDVRLYDGATLETWQTRLKSIRFESEAAAKLVPGLLEIVEDESVPAFTRRQAALTLGRIGSPAKKAIPILIGFLKGSTDTETISWAAKALARFGKESSAAAPVLADLLKDETRPHAQRIVAYEPLSMIGPNHPIVIPTLIRMLSAPVSSDSSETRAESAQLRELAAESLAYLVPHSAPALPALTRSLRDENEGVRRKVLSALQALGPAAQPAIPAMLDAMIFDESAAVKEQALLAIAATGKAGVTVFSQLLKHSSALLRKQAARGLEEVGTQARTAQPLLIEALDDADADVQSAALLALWKVSGKQELVLPALITQLQSENRQIRIQAYRILISFEHVPEETVKQLKQLENDARRYVRETARLALRKIQPDAS